ncbi:MAG: HEAT repeat domain-containing protein [Planctomycetes bacterium]|nr:HEAT repeat domain-containing protein [Planctomycetota bacterium]
MAREWHRDGLGGSGLAGLAALGLASLLASCAQAPPPWPAAEEEDLLLDVVRLEAEGSPAGPALFRSALASRLPLVRARAARALARRGAAGGELLSRLLEDPDPLVRREAAWTLGRTGAAAPGALERAAADPSPAVRESAAWALGAIGGPPAAPIEGLLRDPDPAVRREAALALARSSGPAAAPRLLELFRDERDERARWGLAKALALAGAGSSDVEAALAAAVSDRSFLVAVFAIEGLSMAKGGAGTAEALALLGRGGAFWLVEALAARLLADRLGRGALAGDLRSAVETKLEDLAAGPGAARRHSIVRRIAGAARGLAAEPGEGLAPRAGGAPPAGPLALFSSLPPRARRLLPVRSPRAAVRVAGKGEILLDLFALDAPRHVSAFADLAAAGCYDAVRIGPVDPARGVSLADTSKAPAGLAGSPLPAEASPGPILRGALLALDSTGAPSEAAGTLFIALVPIPELEGRATRLGRVALGAEVLDQLEPGDLVESVRLVGP